MPNDWETEEDVGVPNTVCYACSGTGKIDVVEWDWDEDGQAIAGTRRVTGDKACSCQGE